MTDTGDSLTVAHKQGFLAAVFWSLRLSDLEFVSDFGCYSGDSVLCWVAGQARVKKAVTLWPCAVHGAFVFTIHHSPLIIDLGAVHHASGTVSSEIFLGFFAVPTANG